MEKVWIICGDYYSSQQEIKLKTINKQIKYFYNDSDNADIITALSNFSFDEEEQCVVLYNPTTEIEKFLLNNKLACDDVIIYYENIQIDSAIVKEAKKKQHFIEFSYILPNEFDMILTILKNENCKLTKEAKLWLRHNAPTQFVKIGKNDTEVIDLFLLINEIKKFNTCFPILDETIMREGCAFNQVNTIWECANHLLITEPHIAYQELMTFKKHNSIRNLLYVLPEQIRFILYIKDCVKNGIKEITQIQQKLSENKYKEDYVSKPINYWRVKKTLENLSLYNNKLLFHQLNAVESALIDLNSGFDENLITEYLFLALKNKIIYSEPLVNKG